MSCSFNTESVVKWWTRIDCISYKCSMWPLISQLASDLRISFISEALNPESRFSYVVYFNAWIKSRWHTVSRNRYHQQNVEQTDAHLSQTSPPALDRRRRENKNLKEKTKKSTIWPLNHRSIAFELNQHESISVRSVSEKRAGLTLKSASARIDRHTSCDKTTITDLVREKKHNFYTRNS